MEKAKSGVYSAIKFVVALVFLFGLMKWAQANPAQWQTLVNDVINTTIGIITAILNAIAGALPKSTGG